MRISTLLFSLLLCSAGANAQVKKPAKQVKSSPVSKVLKAKRAADAEMKKLWKPGKEEFFFFSVDEWLPEGETTFTYDLAGNVLTETVNFDGDLERTTYTYNENNMKTSEVVAYYDEDEEMWVNDTKTTYAYDAILTDYVTEKFEYTWDDVENDWVNNNGKQSKTYTITRDAKGNITSVELKAYFSYTGEWDIVQRTDITYDEATGKAISFDFRMPTWGENETLVYGDPTRYKNIEWENTDGQITAEDLTECVIGANRIKSADCYEVVGEEEELISHIEATYVVGKVDFELTEASADGTEKSIGKFTTTDANGSVLATTSYYFEDKLEETEYTAVDYDDHGNLTLEEEGMLTVEDEKEIYGGMRYNYTYDAVMDVPTEVVIEEYLFDEYDNGDPIDPDENELVENAEEEVGDEEMTGAYEVTQKLVYSNFFDVLSPTSRINSNVNSSATIYNLQGVAVGRDAKNLPAGLYIIKQGGKVQKMLRK